MYLPRSRGALTVVEKPRPQLPTHRENYDARQPWQTPFEGKSLSAMRKRSQRIRLSHNHQTTVDAARKTNQSLERDFVASMEEFLFLGKFLSDQMARDSDQEDLEEGTSRDYCGDVGT
jgi:hypothetical protein